MIIFLWKSSLYLPSSHFFLCEQSVQPIADTITYMTKSAMDCLKPSDLFIDKSQKLTFLANLFDKVFPFFYKNYKKRRWRTKTEQLIMKLVNRWVIGLRHHVLSPKNLLKLSPFLSTLRLFSLRFSSFSPLFPLFPLFPPSFPSFPPLSLSFSFLLWRYFIFLSSPISTL